MIQCLTSDVTWILQPDNKWNESPWNRKPGETKFRPMSPPPPKPPIIRESCAFAAPFATRDNMVVVKVTYPFSRPLRKPSPNFKVINDKYYFIMVDMLEQRDLRTGLLLRRQKYRTLTCQTSSFSCLRNWDLQNLVLWHFTVWRRTAKCMQQS